MSKKHSKDLTNSEDAPEWFKEAKDKYPGIEFRVIIDEDAAENEFWEELRGRGVPDEREQDDNEEKDDSTDGEE